LIDKREKVEEMKEKEKLIMFTLQKEILIKSLRFTVLESTNEYCSFLKSFELFGEITQNDLSLQKFLAKSTKMDLITPIAFKYDEFTSIGFFHFFENFSLKDRSNVFEIFSWHTKSNSTSENLLFWNDEECQADSGEFSNVGLEIYFKFPYAFQPKGYRFRSGKTNFVKNWTVIGIQSEYGKGNRKRIYLDEQKDNQDLARSSAEKSFKINCQNFLDILKFELEENSEGQKEFNLAGLELFGILTKVQ
jgi:hypothetical protein